MGSFGPAPRRAVGGACTFCELLRHDRFDGRHERPRKVARSCECYRLGTWAGCRTEDFPAAVWDPGFFCSTDLGGLVTVLSDHGRLRTGLSSAEPRVCGESVGTLSDPS